MNQPNLAFAALGLATFLPVWTTPALASDTEPVTMALGISEIFGRWPGGVVTYVYNPTDAPATFSDDNYFLALLQNAMANLEGVSGLTFDYQGIDSNATIMDLNDGVVVIGWDTAIGGAAGQAGPATLGCFAQDVVDTGYCPYSDGSVRLNPNDATWSAANADATERLFDQVVTHELVHLAGIGHSETPFSIMFADPYTNLHGLRDDDVEQLQGLYGEPEQFVGPAGYVPPAAGAASVTDSFLATESEWWMTEIKTVDDDESAAYVGLTWQVPAGAGEMTIITVDPDGFYYATSVRDWDCMGAGCLYWSSAVRVEVLQTYPGTWTIYGIVDGDLVAEHNVLATVVPAVNQAPQSSLEFDTLYGPAPLTVTGTLTVTGDAEGDAVDATWHIPSIGETALDSGNFPGGAGQNTQSVTFATPGEYEIYVEVNDDWNRYGEPGAGDSAGPGYRTIYRRVVHVTSVSDDITTASDVSGDAIPDIAGFVGDYNGMPQIGVFSGADGERLSVINYMNSNWRGIALGTIRDANQDGTADDPAVAMLGDNKITSKNIVQTRRLDNGALLRNIFFLNDRWRAIDVVVIDDTNGDGITNDTSIGVLAERKSDGMILVQIRSLGSGALVANYNYLNSNWTAVAAAVVDRSSQIPIGSMSPLVGVLAENGSGGKRVVQSRLVSNGHLNANTYFTNSNWSVRDVTVVHDANGDGALTDPAWQVLAQKISNGDQLIQTRFVSTGSLHKNMNILNHNWNAIRLDSGLDMSGNTAPEVAVSTRKESDDTRLFHIKDYATENLTENIFP